MNKKIKIIDLLCLISNGEEVPKEIKYKDYIFSWDNTDKDYYCEEYGNLFEYLFSEFQTNNILNNEVEILDDEEDKDIPLIPDDELVIFDKPGLDFNFKVLKEKINQVANELNNTMKEINNLIKNSK